LVLILQILEALVDYYLPKPAIDRTTIKMADLLRQRYDTPLKIGEEKEKESVTKV
jgi:hypothetical protein